MSASDGHVVVPRSDAADLAAGRTRRRRAASRPIEVDEISDEASFLELLDILNERLIAEGKEAITFDHDCREGICGTCSLMINGQAHGPQRGTATCQLHMRKFHDGAEIVVEPWRARAFPIIKDLMCDRGAVRPHRRGRRLHHRADRRRARRQPHPDPQAGVRRRRGRRPRASAAVPASPPARTAPPTCSPAAKIAHLNLLPQGQAERYQRTEAMVETMDEYFGSCTNHGECEAACPKEISIDVIALMNADYLKAKFKNRKLLTRT